MTAPTPSREQLLHSLYEAAELEHNLMCTYLYAAFSLKQGEEEGLSALEARTLARWRREIMDVAIDEMGHLTAVWNITCALGGVPRFGRANFPLDPGYLPALVVVKLAPFNDATLQHFVFLERPRGSSEPDGEGFAPERLFSREYAAPRLTPMGVDYETVGDFYNTLSEGLRRFVERQGEAQALGGERALQLSASEVNLTGAKPVICLKTALQAMEAIVRQGEGAQSDETDSHYQRFVAIRKELAQLRQTNPAFVPAHPAATNPVLRRPPRPEGRVWLEDPQAIASVDLANASYGLMLRLLAYAYALRGPAPEKTLTIDLALGLMRAVVPLAEHAARLPAGPSHPQCHAGMTFTALRDSAAFIPGAAARRFFVERLEQLGEAAHELGAQVSSARLQTAATALTRLSERAQREWARPEERTAAPESALTAARAMQAPAIEVAAQVSAAHPAQAAHAHEAADAHVEVAEASDVTLYFEGRRCIHARHCVTGAPQVFLANVQGAWLFPDRVPVDRVVEIAHACPSGAIRYRRKDGQPDEAAPAVNLASVRECGPYALRGDLHLRGEPIGRRATLCRCGASRRKPFCDGSHHDQGFSASGEPQTGLLGQSTDMLPVRDGVLALEPEPDGPLQVRGNLEIVSGTGRMVCRVTQAKLCRCGGSQSKPFCDGTHARIGFRAD